jgi:hypothetical protein
MLPKSLALMCGMPYWVRVMVTSYFRVPEPELEPEPLELLLPELDAPELELLLEPLLELELELEPELELAGAEPEFDPPQAANSVRASMAPACNRNFMVSPWNLNVGTGSYAR